MTRVSSRGRTLIAIFGLIWLVFIVLAYYLTHKPFTPDLALGLALNTWQVLIAICILSVGGGLGRRILPDLQLNPLAALAVQASLGIGIISILLLFAGAVGGLHSLVLGVGLLLLIILLRRDILDWFNSWRSVLNIWQRSGFFGRLLSCGLLLILGFAGLVALSPPVNFDALVYHLALPKAYLDAGRIFYVADNMFWGMPQTGEMIYTWAMALAGDAAAQLCGLLVGCIAVVGMLGFLQNSFSERAGLVGSVSLLSGFTLASSLAWGYIDWFTILFGFSAFVLLDLWRRERQPMQLLLAGVFTGFAMGTKYTAGVLFLGGIVALFWFSYRKDGVTKTLQTLFIYIGSTVLVFSPWLFKNWIAVGNPIYPLLFPSGAMTALRLDLYQGGVPWGGWQDALFLPFRATVYGVQGAPGYNASIGPLLLGLGFLAWVGWQEFNHNQRSLVRFSTVIAVTGILIWVIIGRFSAYLLQSRLYFAIFPAFVVLAGAGYAGMRKMALPGMRVGRIVEALILLVFGFTIIEIGVDTIRRGAVQTALALQDKETYLENNLGWLAPAMEVINTLPENSRVIMLWEPRNLYCFPKCEPDEILDRWTVERYANDADVPRSPETILASWKESGYTHLFFYRAGAEFIHNEGGPLSEDDWSALGDLLDDLPEYQEFGQAYTLYSLEP